MNDPLEIKVRAAAAAGWWTLLIASCFLAVQSIFYLIFMSLQPAWLLSLWEPGMNWDTFGRMWFWLLVIFKFCIWLLALPVLWMTLWARQLRMRRTGA